MGRTLTKVSWSPHGDVLALVGWTSDAATHDAAWSVLFLSITGDVLAELKGLPANRGPLHSFLWDPHGVGPLIASPECLYFATVRHTQPWAWYGGGVGGSGHVDGHVGEMICDCGWPWLV